MPVDWCPQYGVKDSQAQKDGDWYAAANGGPTWNEGEEILLLPSLDGHRIRTMAFQVAKVNKPLASVGKLLDT